MERELTAAPMSTALIYRRVSTGEQARSGYSLEEQLRECRKKAAELRASEIIDIEDDLGGDYLERPQFQRVLDLCEQGRIRWLICFDPDRFSRRLLNQQLAVQAIERAGTEIIFTSHEYEKSPEGRMFLQMRGVIAEFEKAKILDRTRRGKRNKLRAGEMPGWFDPYGYRLNPATDLLELDESQARWVRQIYEWAANPDPSARLTISGITKRLNQTGVPAPRGNHWYRSTVHGILRNIIYTGVLYWGRYSHEGVWQARRAGIRPEDRPKPTPRPESEWHRLTVPAIISPALWQRTQEYIALDKNRRSPRRTYMLTGLVRCGLCGASAGVKRPKSGRYYCCSRRYLHSADRCTLPHIKADKVEAFVWRAVCQLVQRTEVLAHSLHESSVTADPTRGELERVAAELEENRRSQERLIAMLMRTGVSSDVTDKQLRELVQQGERLKKRQAQLRSQQSKAHRTEPSAASLASMRDPVSSRLEHLSDERRTELVRRFVSRVYLAGREESQWSVTLI